MGFFLRWASFEDGLLFEMGFFSRWASFRDGLLFNLGFFSRRASFRDGLPFEMGFFSRWASFRDGLLFEMGFFSSWASFRDGLLFEMNAGNIDIADYKTMNKTTAQIFQILKRTRTSLFAFLKMGFFQEGFLFDITFANPGGGVGSFSRLEEWWKQIQPA